MHVTLVTCRFDPTLGAFDDAPLRACTRDKVVLDVREYFHTSGSLPHLTFVLTYRLVPPSAPDGSSGKLDRKRPRTAPSTSDLRAGLAPEQRELFDLLRDWRNRTAREEGVPAYAVLTNKQLLALVRDPPTTQRGLQRVEGLGRKKSQRYGKAILAITRSDPVPATDEPSEPQAKAPQAPASAGAGAGQGADAGAGAEAGQGAGAGAGAEAGQGAGAEAGQSAGAPLSADAPTQASLATEASA